MWNGMSCEIRPVIFLPIIIALRQQADASETVSLRSTPSLASLRIPPSMPRVALVFGGVCLPACAHNAAESKLLMGRVRRRPQREKRRLVR